MFRSIRGLAFNSVRYSSYSSNAIVQSSTESSQQNVKKTISYIQNLYHEKKPITMVTAFDSITSRMSEEAQIDITLVGDSLANTSLGYRDTNQLNLEEMLYHVRSVRRGNQFSLLVADLPFGSYEVSIEQATATAIQMVKAGAQAVKLEGADDETVRTIKKLVNTGIPVMGHVGLTPQKHNTMGGYKLQGTSTESAMQVLEAAKKIQEAGVFSMVLECVPYRLGEIITQELSVPTIGIGAGGQTSGQVLVIADLLGMQPGPLPRFAKTYANFFDNGVLALKTYAEEVRSEQFPLQEHGYKIKKTVLEEVRKNLEK